MPPRVARFGCGHHPRVSLSPVSAISDMVAPVVLITLATIFSNVLLTVATVTWWFSRSRLSESNRRPIHYE
jgi:hypothetical protein